MRMTSLGPLDLEVVVSLLLLWLSLITFMVSGFITFVIESYYIYGQFLLHLWLTLHLWFLLHLGVMRTPFSK